MSMGGNFLGMDTAAVRQLAQQMDSVADTIQQAMQRLTSQLGSTDWRGNDSNKFRNDWQAMHCRELNHVISNLKANANIARQNATQQEQASA